MAAALCGHGARRTGLPRGVALGGGLCVTGPTCPRPAGRGTASRSPALGPCGAASSPMPPRDAPSGEGDQPRPSSQGLPRGLPHPALPPACPAGPRPGRGPPALWVLQGPHRPAALRAQGSRPTSARSLRVQGRGAEAMSPGGTRGAGQGTGRLRAGLGAPHPCPSGASLVPEHGVPPTSWVLPASSRPLFLGQGSAPHMVPPQLWGAVQG